MLKKLMMSTALSAVMATAAFAQAPSSPSSSTPAPAAQSQGSGKANFVTAQKPDQWLATKFKGTDVLGADNQKIGDVSEFCSTRAGRSTPTSSVSVASSASVRRTSRSNRATSKWCRDKMSADKLKLSMTKDELQQAENFERYKAPVSHHRLWPGRDGWYRPTPSSSAARPAAKAQREQINVGPGPGRKARAVIACACFFDLRECPPPFARPVLPAFPHPSTRFLPRPAVEPSPNFDERKAGDRPT